MGTWNFGPALRIAVSSVAIIFRIRIVESMKEEYASTIKDLREQIIDIKNEATGTSKNINQI